ncbi:MAG: formylglycine-generating enzyme family protein, partial [Planctomycetes bacterium]|nr:formylglycine-generating enzyme family protein [Planctomycetota bacterium]
MCHARLLLLIPLLGAVSCGKSDSSRSSAGDEEMISLEVLSPPSGGEMLLVPAGEFTMGQADGRPDENPHAVRLSAFWIDRHPVTQGLYEEILGANPSRRKDPESPVSGVYWTDAARFCNRCSESDGLKPCYDLETWTCDFAASGYRLPTEAEWEYACRAGSDSIYFFGDDPAELPRFAWSKPHSRGRTHPVGMREPNRWGLHDMLGNVWEWTGDWYGETYYQQSPVEDPRGPAAGTMRVLRGGAWSSPPEQCRVAYRGKEFPVFQ